MLLCMGAHAEACTGFMRLTVGIWQCWREGGCADCQPWDLHITSPGIFAFTLEVLQ